MSGPWRLPETSVCLNCGAVYYTAEGCNCNPMGSRARMFVVRLSHLLSLPVLSNRAGRCDCPFCSCGERRARVRTGMPMKHPERILRNLSDDQEKLLTALADATWSEAEYLDIIAGHMGEDQ